MTNITRAELEEGGEQLAKSLALVRRGELASVLSQVSACLAGLIDAQIALASGGDPASVMTLIADANAASAVLMDRLKALMDQDEVTLDLGIFRPTATLQLSQGSAQLCVGIEEATGPT